MSLLVLAPILGIAIQQLLFRDVESMSQASKVVVTMALLVLVQGTAVALFGPEQRPVEPFLPTSTFAVGEVAVGWDQVIVVALGLAVLTGLTAFFRLSRLGTAMRAAVHDPDLARAAGFSASRLGALTWSLGAAAAGLAGILFSPLLGLDSIILTLLVVQAYAAAIFGRLTSLPRTFAGALALGLAGSRALNAFSKHPVFLNGFRPSIPFLFLFGALVLAKRGRLHELGASVPWSGTVRTGRGSWLPLVVVLLPVALLLSESRAFILGYSLVIACAFLSITVLTGTSGLISLARAGLVGTGAFVYIHLIDAGVPFLFALVLAGLAVVPLGVVIAIPALRLSGLFLALATFGAGQLIDG
ncbi:MAG: ABC transporter permease subunit, partial [Acidimicrobiales bacterium]